MGFSRQEYWRGLPNMYIEKDATEGWKKDQLTREEA